MMLVTRRNPLEKQTGRDRFLIIFAGNTFRNVAHRQDVRATASMIRQGNRKSICYHEDSHSIFTVVTDKPV